MGEHTMHHVDPSKRQLVDRHGRQRKGAYMHLSNGSKYFPFDPRPEDVDPYMIAHHLACAGRWAGATRHPIYVSRIYYSVAEHSVYVANYVERELRRPDLALEALFHDASEALIGDLIRPLKYDPVFHAPFTSLEKLNEQAIAERFNLIYPWPVEIKIADEAVTNAEFDQIIVRNPDEEWDSGMLHDASNMANYEIQMLEPYHAREMFLRCFHDLIERRARYRPLPKDFRV